MLGFTRLRSTFGRLRLETCNGKIRKAVTKASKIHACRNFPDPDVVNGLIECERLSNLG
jgi:hypothetical protein